ncbi:F0F1 ATP synthase subunit A [Mariniplasma anaerobium]|uniref:ATP synthase subunit a n=1 Tax=Mariniplasma anaerobium TaxID=2735436 RepID=A0A7U9XV75_9MOLU|nr:F0F1 ATP synthase subunit A [Mariniplasma anaerobium]BCR35442.1 ATP synthase subunit a [Mariniplasma anaerobium]
MFDQVLDYLTHLPVYFLTSLGIILVLIIFSVVIGNYVSKLDVRDKPNIIATLVIQFIDFFNNYVKSYIGKHWKFVTPITLTLALYVAVANMSGILALEAPTRYTSITFSLSIISFIVVQATGFISQSWRHLLGLFKPLWPLFPLNLISDVTPILSMALRLFGNIVSGSVILMLVYKLTGWASIIVAPAFHLVFDIGFGLVQTLVLVLLTIVFASIKIDEDDLDFNKN